MPSAGNAALAEHLADAGRTPLSLVSTALETLQATEGAANHVMVIRNLDAALGQAGDLFQKVGSSYS